LQGFLGGLLQVFVLTLEQGLQLRHRRPGCRSDSAERLGGDAAQVCCALALESGAEGGDGLVAAAAGPAEGEGRHLLDGGLEHPQVRLIVFVFERFDQAWDGGLRRLAQPQQGHGGVHAHVGFLVFERLGQTPARRSARPGPSSSAPAPPGGVPRGRDR